MFQIPHRLQLLAFLATANLCICLARGEEAAIAPPVAYVAVSGLDAVLDDVDYLAGVSNTQKYAQLLRGFLANLNDLKGIARDRPIGMLIYVPESEGEEGKGLFFIPVDDIDALKETAKVGNLFSLEAGKSEDWLNLRTPEETIPLKLAHGYAFFGDTPALLDRELPNPELAVAELLKKYDAVFTLRREGLSAGEIQKIKTQLSEEASKFATENSGESVDKQLAREIGEIGFEIAGAFVDDVQGLDVGWTISRENRSLTIDANLVFRPGSEWSEALKSMAVGPSRFAAIVDEPAPFSIITHFLIPQRVQNLLGRVIAHAQQHADTEIPEDAAALRPHVKATLESLGKTIETGIVDGFVNIVGGPPENYVAVGGLSLVGADAVSKAVSAVLPFANESSNETKIEMDVVRVADVPFHRVTGHEKRPHDRILYGDDASLLVGAGQEAIWFAVGESGAEKRLTEVVSPDVSSDKGGSSDPFLTTRLYLTDWLSLVSQETDDKSRKFREAGAKAFPQPVDDLMELTLAPIENGVQLRLSFEEGYLRLVGYGVLPE